jgi:transposase
MAQKYFTQPPSLRFQGIDVSKATFDVACWGDQSFQKMAVRRFPRTPEGVHTWLSRFGPGELDGTAAVMESTGGYCKQLAGWILQIHPDFHVAIANPFMVKSYGRSLGLRNKTDRVDARMLAKFGQERQPNPWHPLPKEQEELRDLVRTREKIKRTLVAFRHRVKEHESASAIALEAQKELVKTLAAQIKQIEKGIRKLMTENPELKRDCQLLQSISGVGLITAAGVMGAAGDLRRFRRRGELCAYLGVSPRQFQSGTSVNGKTHLCRMGGKRVRSILYMAALTACRSKGSLGAYYRRLVEGGKSKKSALGALMRKLLTVMRAVLIQGRPYETLGAPKIA